MKNLQYLSKKHIGAREDQQDSVNITQNGDDIFVALGDGMGGHTGGAKASNIFITVAQNHFENKSYKNPKEFFEDIIYEAEEKIDEYENQSGENPHTTATLALLKNNHIYFSNIGDSRIYIFTRDGLAVRTRDHSVPEMLFQMGEITEKDMATHPDQNKLTKSLGPKTHEKLSYYEHEIEDDKEFIILVCSDGFWEYVQEREMMYWANSFELEYALSKMIEIARINGGDKGDNISVGIVTNRILKTKKNKNVGKVQDIKNEESVVKKHKKKKSKSLDFSMSILLVIVSIGIIYYSGIIEEIYNSIDNKSVVLKEVKKENTITKPTKVITKKVVVAVPVEEVFMEDENTNSTQQNKSK